MAPRGTRRGRLTLTYTDGTERREAFRVARGRSGAEAVLAGYGLALSLVRPGTDSIVFRVEHRAVDGYLNRGHRVRSPDILRRWEVLLARVDAVPAAVFSQGDGAIGQVNWKSFSRSSSV